MLVMIIIVNWEYVVFFLICEENVYVSLILVLFMSVDVFRIFINYVFLFLGRFEVSWGFGINNNKY